MTRKRGSKSKYVRGVQSGDHARIHVGLNLEAMYVQTIDIAETSFRSAGHLPLFPRKSSPVVMNINRPP